MTDAERDLLRRAGDVIEDAMKALPVLRTMLDSAGLVHSVIVAEDMIQQSRSVHAEIAAALRTDDAAEEG
jgi:hypothetical protein